MMRFLKHLTAAALALIMVVSAGSFAETAQTSAPVVPNGSDFAPQSETARETLIQEAAQLPAKLDLRDLDGVNYVTTVKTQRPFSTCWAFGITGAAEISFLHDNGIGVPAGQINDLVDFSENTSSGLAATRSRRRR